MPAYLIVTIALLPVSPIINVAARVHNRFLTRFGVDTKNDEQLGVAMIAGSIAIMIICLAFYAFIVLGILSVSKELKTWVASERDCGDANCATQAHYHLEVPS
jgi:Na+/proline symporter